MNIDEYVKSFSTHIGNAVKAIEEASKTYANAVKEHGFATAHEAFARNYPQATDSTWAKLMAIGTGSANPNIMFFSDKFAARIMRMPKKTQDEVLNGNSFAVVNTTTREIELINYADLRPRHERLLFNDNTTSMRTIQEQVAYADLLESARKRTNAPYAVKGDHLEVYRACSISTEEIEAISDELHA